MPTKTIITRDADTGALADTPDLVVVMREDSGDTTLTPVHVGTGEYTVSFDFPAGFGEMIASSIERGDKSVVWSSTLGSIDVQSDAIATNDL